MRRVAVMALVLLVAPGAAMAAKKRVGLPSVPYASPDGLTPEQRAQQRYEQTWAAADSYLGSDGRPSPLVGWGESGWPNDQSHVSYDENGIRRVYTSAALDNLLGYDTYVAPPDREQLRRIIRQKIRKNDGQRAGQIRRKVKRRAAARTSVQQALKDKIVEAGKGTLLHEWAHVYQDPAITERNLMEGGADLFKRNVGEQILGPGRDDDGYYPDEYAQQFIAKYGPDAYRQAQFGSNWGADPRTIDRPWWQTGSPPYAAAETPDVTSIKQALRRIRRGRAGAGQAARQLLSPTAKPRVRLRARRAH